MKIRIEDITADAREIAFSESALEVNRLLDKNPIHEYHVEGPIGVEVSYYRSGMDLFFEGDLNWMTTATCARCVDEFNVTGRRHFRLVLAPKAVGDEGQADLREEDLDFSVYGGEDVDLSPLVHEQVLLALPTRPLCRDDCAGLCSVCGGNRNEGACDCRVEVPDERLAVLRSLKVQRP